jgi:hypothetical protein
MFFSNKYLRKKISFKAAHEAAFFMTLSPLVGAEIVKVLMLVGPGSWFYRTSFIRKKYCQKNKC